MICSSSLAMSNCPKANNAPEDENKSLEFPVIPRTIVRGAHKTSLSGMATSYDGTHGRLLAAYAEYRSFVKSRSYVTTLGVSAAVYILELLKITQSSWMYSYILQWAKKLAHKRSNFACELNCGSEDKGKIMGKLYNKGRHLILCSTKLQKFSYISKKILA